MRSTDVKLPLIDLGKKGKIILTKEIQDQIDFLHSKIGNIEWIGVLCFKKLQGTLAEADNIIIEARHIYLMSVDTAGHTDADMEGSVVDIYDTVPDMMEMRMGLIHSHHSMATFFSGEDLDELKINTPLHNYYVSLIVNKDGNYCAKLCWVGDINTEYSFTDVSDTTAKLSSKNKVIFNIDLAIVKEKRSKVSELFEERYDSVRKVSEEKEAQRKAKYSHTTYTNYTPKTPFSESLLQGSLDYDRGSFKDLRSGEDTAELVKRWLNEGAEYALDMEPPGLFNTISSGVNFFSKYFAGKSPQAVEHFCHYMQKGLFDLTLDVKPSEVVRHINMIGFDSSTIGNAFRNIVQKHPAFCAAQKRNIESPNFNEREWM